MSGAEIKVDEFTPTLVAIAARLTDMSPVFQDIGEYLIDSTKQRFTEGTAPDGTAWVPKSQATIDAYRSREAKGGNAKIDFRPLFGASGSLSSNILYEAVEDGVQWGSNMVYAAVQHFGAAAGELGVTSSTDKNGRPYTVASPWGDIPARPFIGISDTDRETILADLSEWIKDGS